MLAESIDGGSSFGLPRVISEDKNLEIHTPEIASTSDGKVYLCYVKGIEDNTDIFCNHSNNTGITFSNSTNVTNDPSLDLQYDLLRDRLLVAGQLQCLKKSQRLLQWQRADLVQVLVRDAHMARFQTQARAFAFRAGAAVQIFRQLLAHGGRVGLVVAAFQIVYDTLEHMFAQRRFAALADVLERDLGLAAAIQDHLLDLVRQAFEGLLDIEVVMLGETREQLVIELVAPVPALDRAGAQAERREGDDALRVEKIDVAEPVALRARAHRVVEREQARFQFRQ